MQRFSVLLVGAGQLGSRHLQGLMAYPNNLNVDVVDVNQNSLEMARSRAEEIPGIEKHQLNFKTSLEEIKSSYDLAIVATSAAHRAELVKMVLSKSKIKFMILEKILFQKISDYSSMLDFLRTQGVKTWVNCPRRYYPFYQSIRDAFQGQKVEMKVEGGPWGLLCNSIHFIDLFSFLTGFVPMQVDHSELKSPPFPSKRDGFYEAEGKISLGFEEGKLELFSKAEAMPLEITIQSARTRVEVLEGQNQATINGTLSSFQPMFQSQLTTKILQDIQESGNCSLTNFDLSCRYHLPFIESITNYFSKQDEVYPSSCPVT